VSRILLVRLDGLGDALCLAPLVAALRDAGHELGALLSPGNRAAFAPGALAHVHVVERRPWPAHGFLPDSELRAWNAMKPLGYEIALIASEEPDAYRIAMDLGIPRRVGFTNGIEKPFKSLWTRSRLTRAIVRPASGTRAGEHEVETLFALGDGLHGEAAPTRDVRRLRPLIVPASERGDALAIQVSAKLAAFGLTPAAYGAIAAAAAGEGPLELLVAPGSEALAREAERRSGAVAETLGIDAWKERLARARAVVTPDSGAAHVCGMTGTPCVDIFARSPQVEADVLRWRPWAAPAAAIVADPRDPALAEKVRSALAGLAAAA
jgi:ADP-heptose:LPS heptosyltransferase